MMNSDQFDYEPTAISLETGTPQISTLFASVDCLSCVALFARTAWRFRNVEFSFSEPSYFIKTSCGPAEIQRSWVSATASYLRFHALVNC